MCFRQLIESGASRHQGVVKKLTPDFGFLQSLSCPDSIYFSTADISTNEAGRVRVGAQVTPSCLRYLEKCYCIEYSMVLHDEIVSMDDSCIIAVLKDRRYLVHQLINVCYGRLL